MVGSTVEDQENLLPAVFSGQNIEVDLEAGSIRCGHDQIDASSILGTDRAVEVDILANELRGDLGSDASLMMPSKSSLPYISVVGST